MKHRGLKYRAWAIGCSVVTHAVLFAAATLILTESEVKAPEYIAIEILRREAQQPEEPTVIKQPSAREPVRVRQQSSETNVTRPNVQLPPPPADVPVLSPNEPVAMSELEMIDRAFFGDSLYAIIKIAPHLKPLVLRQMLVENVPTTDSLETLRKQLAEAMLPYINMSDAERQAYFHMKLFGSATNPMRPGPIPGNIPISDILRALIELLK